MGRLPFGVKYGSYMCQQVVAHVIQGALPPGILLVHYLDDFLWLFFDPIVLRAVGHDAVLALVRAGFLNSPQSVLKLVIPVSFLGKCLNLTFRTLCSHPHALLRLWVNGLG